MDENAKMDGMTGGHLNGLDFVRRDLGLLVVDSVAAPARRDFRFNCFYLNFFQFIDFYYAFFCIP